METFSSNSEALQNYKRLKKYFLLTVWTVVLSKESNIQSHGKNRGDKIAISC